jgi:hypothetical protein
MNTPPYPYSQGNRLEERNTYFYSEYHGQAFFMAWRNSREQTLAELPPGAAPQIAASMLSETAAGYDTQQLLAFLLNADLAQAQNRRLAEQLLQRFEVSKRIYRRYDVRFKAIVDSGYEALEFYPQFAALCLRLQDQPAPLPFLNGLLKSIDTLIAIRDRLSPALGAQLAWLIDREAQWVARIATAAQVDMNR